MLRRDFLKSVVAACVLGPSLLQGQPLSVLSSPQYLGEKLRNILDITTVVKTLGNNTGENLLLRNSLLRANAPTIANSPRTLLFLAQITDTHLMDEESPARVAAAETFLEELGVGSAFHLNEDLTTQVCTAMMAQLNQIHSQSALDFVLNTGDSLDNAQSNELGWFLRILEGGHIDPDSGTDQDPISGANNDANDSFITRGLNSKIPYYTAIGNHDILLQGNVPSQLREAYNAIAKKILEIMTIHDPVGFQSNAVLLPWATPPNPKEFRPGTIIPDSQRYALDGREFIRQHAYFPTFRPTLGFPKNLPDANYGYYSVYPKPGLPLRMIVLDTVLRLGTAIGAISKTQFHEFLIPTLEDAKAKQELVIIVSHHPGKTIKTLPVGRAEMLARYGRNTEIQKVMSEMLVSFEHDNSYVSGNEFEQTLQSYPNVFLHIAGHRHCHEIRQVGEAGHGYWEIQTSSLLTYPQQARILEIVYEGNNIGAVQTCILDHTQDESSLAAYSRRLALQDAQKSRTEKRGKYQDRNVILRFPILPEIAKKL